MKILTGRKYEHAAGLSGLSPQKIAKWREHLAAQGYELPPLPDRFARTVATRQRPGSLLAETFAWIAAGKGGCSSCSSLAARMDRHGCDWCQRNADYIVDRIMSNATKLFESGIVSRRVFGSSVGNWLAERVVRIALSKAIARAREEAVPKRTRRVGGRRRHSPRLRFSPAIPSEPIPLPDRPSLSLMFHVYPRGNWRQHVERLAPLAGVFDRQLLGISTDTTTATAGEVAAAFGPDWEVFTAENKQRQKGKQGLREVATYRQMLPTLDRGPEHVTFCGHGKGVQDHNNNDVIRWWIDALYETVLYNWQNVVEEFRTGAAIVGSFRRRGGFLGCRHKYHYSGTFYAFRNAITFSRGVPDYRDKWFGTESWPGDYFPIESSRCMFADDVGNLYKERNQPREALEEWRRQNGTVGSV